MKRSLLLPASLAIVLLASGCTIEGQMKYTGGGTMNSSGGTGKANLTVNADTCGISPKGRIKYQDNTAIDFLDKGGVSLDATILKAGICTQTGILSEDPEDPYSGQTECTCPGWPAVKADYTSTNPKLPGSGRLLTCFYNFRNQGEQSNESEMYVRQVTLTTGPYAGYTNAGTLSGNIHQASCR
jgi:hypothetical protein